MLLTSLHFCNRASIATASIAMKAASADLLCGLDGSPIPLSELSDAASALVGNAVDVVRVQCTSEYLQPGSHSGVLQVSLADDSVREIFLKKITANHRPMAERPWPDRRRTLAYARTEARFYQEFAADPEISQRLESLGVRMPRLAKSDNRLDGVLGGAAVHEAAGEEPSAAAQEAAGALLFLQSATVGYTQASPLTEAEAQLALEAIAGFHAAFWEDPTTLQAASERLQRHGGVYALEIRSQAEVERIRTNWDAFLAEFETRDPSLFERPGVAALGERLDRWAAFASEQMSPGPTDRFATLVHGDLKAMNIMLPAATGSNEGPGADRVAPMLIDFASTGVGLGMSDVAMLLAHSVGPETLGDGGLERLLDGYLNALAARGVDGYDKGTALRHFHLATVDYARFVVSRFWAGASAAAFAKRAANPNVCLPNRDVEAACKFVERVDASLEVLDGGGGTCC